MTRDDPDERRGGRQMRDMTSDGRVRRGAIAGDRCTRASAVWGPVPARRVRANQRRRKPMGEHTWNRRLLVRRGAAAGVGAAGLIATGRAVVAAQATPEPAAGPAGCDPLALLPKVPAFRV